MSAGNVRTLGAVHRTDWAEQIAEGLEQMARDIRAGELGFVPMLCSVVLMQRPHDGGDMVTAYHGADSSVVELVGMLEAAKHRALMADG